MKLWFYTIKTAHHITGEIVSMEFGVVRAVDVDSAREKVWAKIGSDHKYDLEVFRLLPGRFSLIGYPQVFSNDLKNKNLKRR